MSKEIPLHASMGWALFPNDGEELEVLIDNADRHWYRDTLQLYNYTIIQLYNESKPSGENEILA